MAATGEYTRFHGGTVAKALSAITTTVARVNQIYERDLAVKLELVANNDQIIFTDANTDPYSNNNNSEQLIDDNQFVIDERITADNYDVGHVMTQNNGGGLAYFAAVCTDSVKASAMTGDITPQNDPFDIDFVAHELGHQFAGTHSFNATTGSCGGGNRNALTAWEIGSGVTIMGYAGICAENNIQEHSIAMFHIGNIRAMGQFINDPKQGALCGTPSNLSNQQPSANAGSNYTIPAKTPFQLIGTGTDPNNSDILTYSWEQMDIGSSTNISNGDRGNNPLFRAFLPSHINSRTFPQLNDILNNTQTKGEILPTTSRSLTFALTVRDQKGGVADDETTLTVIKTSTPFKITSHTATTTLVAGSTVDILWDVADTNTSPINCTAVDISISIDGGNTFETVLAQNSRNDGSETVIIPSTLVSNNSTRFKVACSNNIFFDISDSNLTLSSAAATTTNTAATRFNEGSSNHINYFKLALSTALSIDSSVSFETRNGTAIAGSDYIASSGKATIPAGKTETLIGVTIIADSIAEADETFSLVITQPINGTFPQNVSEITATHTILNDD
jgi:hypothetical protein